MNQQVRREIRKVNSFSLPQLLRGIYHLSVLAEKGYAGEREGFFGGGGKKKLSCQNEGTLRKAKRSDAVLSHGNSRLLHVI